MFSFKGYQTKAKNKHLEHLEDQIIDEGSKGGDRTVENTQFVDAGLNMRDSNRIK